MTRARTCLAIDESYISELLEVAASILQRHSDRALAEKAAALERCHGNPRRCVLARALRCGSRPYTPGGGGAVR